MGTYEDSTDGAARRWMEAQSERQAHRHEEAQLVVASQSIVNRLRCRAESREGNAVVIIVLSEFCTREVSIVIRMESDLRSTSSLIC